MPFKTAGLYGMPSIPFIKFAGRVIQKRKAVTYSAIRHVIILDSGDIFYSGKEGYPWTVKK